MCRSTTIGPFLAALLFAVLVGFAAGEESAAKKDMPDQARTRELISQLGAEQFSTREAAAERLRILGDKLLFEPEFGEGQGLGALERFHKSFILPLYAARQHKNLEVRQRVNAIFNEYAFDRPMGGGASGWALYAAYRLRSKIPQPLTHNEERLARKGLDGEELLRFEYLNKYRGVVHGELQRLAIRNMARENPRDTAVALRANRLVWRSLGPTPRLDLVIDVWAKQDFEAALSYFLDVQRKRGYCAETQRAFPVLIEAWPKDRTIKEAAAWVEKFPGQRLAANFPYDVMRRLIKEDLEQALRLAANLQWKEQRKGMHNMIIQEVAKTDLKKAEELIEAIDDPDLRKQKRAILILEKLRRCEPVDDSVFESYGEESADNFRSWRVKYLAEKDPVAASKLVTSPKSWIKQHNLAAAVARNWAPEDAGACATWARTLEDERVRARAMVEVSVVLADSDVEAATKLLETVREQRNRRTGYLRIITRVAEKDASKAQRLCEKFFGPKTILPMSAVAVWAARDPRAAAEWCDDTADRPDHRFLLSRLLADTWAATDPLAACRWLLSIRDDEERFFALVEYANRMLGEFSDNELTF